MNKNDRTEVHIEDFTKKGEGIGHVNGYTLFVKDAVIDDTVIARITRPKKNYAYARTEQVVRASADRVKAQCPEARRCGGCSFQECRYEKQLAWKQGMVENLMRRLGKFPDPEVRPVIGMDNPYRYRNKAQYPLAEYREPNGRVTVRGGFYAGHTHTLIPVTDCLLTREVSGQILNEYCRFLADYGISVYNEETGDGLARHLLIREGFGTGEIMMCPVINGRRMPHTREFVDRFRTMFGVKSICLNVNTSSGNVILGRETLPLYGNPWITDRLGGLRFRISPVSFYQVNPIQTEKLYAQVLSAAQLTGNETVFDLYSGIGTISLFLAGDAKEVYGIEIVPDAVGDARINAELNGIRNAHFYTGAAEKLVVGGFLAPGVPCPRADVVVLDPPRKGCDRRLIDAVLAMAPDRVVYVSCDPATLARDLRIFADGNGRTAYGPEYIQPVDMFPMTSHVETVTSLVRK